MASSFSLPSEFESSFSLPQLKCNTASEETATTTAGGFNRSSRIMWKFSSKGKKKTDEIVANVTEKALDATNGDESEKIETKEAEKSKRTFSTFLVSLGKEKTEADLLAMRRLKQKKKSADSQKKGTKGLQNSFQDGLSFFSTDNCADSMGFRFNLEAETLKNEARSSDGRRKITLKFRTAGNKKNEDMAMTKAVDQNQTLVSTEFEELSKAETWKNKKKVSETVNQTLIAGEPVQPESTQLRTVQLIKENGDEKKRTFSTFYVSLTREEIEADFSNMGGFMRARRIKKRPKNVQRQLDDLFPGLLLTYITRDDYKVREDKN